MRLSLRIKLSLALLLPAVLAGDTGSCTINTVAGAVGQPGAPVPAILAQLYGTIAIGPSGAIYLAGTSQVFRIVAGVLYTVAGSPQTTDSSGDEGPAVSAHFSNLASIAVGADESIYLVDSARVRKITPDGIVHAFAGTGQVGFSGDRGAATSARIQSGASLALDRAGNVFISDLGNYRIRMVSLDGTISTVVGVGGGYSPPGDGGPATSAQLTVPGNIAIDSAGKIYLVDNGRLRVVGADGIIHAFAGTVPGGETPIVAGTFQGLGRVGVDGSDNVYFADGFSSPNFSYGLSSFYRASANGALATIGSAQSTSNLTVDLSGNLYYFSSNTMYELAPSGAIQAILGGNSNSSTPVAADGVPATIVPLSPQGITTDAAGNLYISDGRTSRIRKVGPDGIISTFAGGAPKDGGDGSPALAAVLIFPTQLAFDPAGNLFFNTIDRIRKVTPDGLIATVAGGGSITTAGDGGPATAISLQSPRGLATDSAGVVYFSDINRNLIRTVTPDGNVHTIAGTGTQAFPPTKDGGPALQSPLSNPTSLAVDSAGVVWFVEGGGVRFIGADGILRTLLPLAAAPFSLSSVAGLAVDQQSNVYISLGHRVLRIDANGGVRTLAGNYKSGYSGDGGSPENALLASPSTLWLDNAGNLFVIDGQVVREITNTAGCSAPAIPELSSTSFDGVVDVGTTAPGKRITLTGINLGPVQTVTAQPDGNGLYPTQLAGIQVSVNNTPAPLLAVQNSSISFVTPYSAVTGTLQVQAQGVLSVPAKITVMPMAAAIFFSAPGPPNMSPSYGPAYALNEDGTLNSASNPAAAGSVMAVYLTGEGQTDPPGVDGKIALDPVPKPKTPPFVQVAGISTLSSAYITFNAEVTFYGEKPGEIGKMQVNFRVPPGMKPGSQMAYIYSTGAVIYTN